MLFRQLMRGPFISCESADCIGQITPDNRSEAFSGDVLSSAITTEGCCEESAVERALTNF